MITYKNIKAFEAIKTVIDQVFCDRCKKAITDDFELQEVHHIEFYGGYSSVFGDGAIVNCDLCQHCLKDLIKDFCKIS